MKPSRSLALALALVLLPAAALGQAAEQASVLRVERGLAPPVLVEGDPTWAIGERMKHYNVPGVSVAVIRDFKVVWAKGYGVKDAETREPVTERTLFQAGSISKPVAAAVAHKKVEEGKLRLDEDINAALTSWKLPDNELTAKRKVTLANLLSHTAGLTVHGFPGYAAGAKVPTVVEVLDGAPPANTAPVRVNMEPGTKFRYSGGGTTIMQLAVQDVEKRPFDAVAKATVLDPLGMTDSTYSNPLPEGLRKMAASGHKRDGSPVPGRFHTYPEMAAAGLWTTPTDLAKFAVEMQLSLAGRSNKVLSKQSVERMVTPYLSENVGMGFFVERHGRGTYFGHNGADEGFLSMLLVHKEKGYGAVVMINGENYQIMPEIVRAVAREYRWEGYMAEPYKRAAVTAEALGGYAGRFRLDADSVLALTVEEGRLVARQPFGPEVELVPISETAFVRRDSTTQYHFERAPDGKGAALAIRDGENATRPERMAADSMAPSELLAAGRFAEAVAAYRELKRADPASRYVDEGRLNGLGYSLLGQRKIAEAIAVFKLNVELYPQSANTYDSLGEAYMEKGDKAEAVENYRRSLELDPKNQNAVRMLERLGN